MALIESNMMELGTKAPDFNLLDTISGKRLNFSEIASEVVTVVVFICNHCPYVHHINSKLVEVSNLYQQKGVRFIAISSNDAEAYPEDSSDKMAIVAKREKYPFPYLYDESQDVAKAYKAACTPDFFVFDGRFLCVYRGRFDSSTPSRGVASGEDLTSALDALLNKSSPIKQQFPSMGCSIKWKK